LPSAQEQGSDNLAQKIVVVVVLATPFIVAGLFLDLGHDNGDMYRLGDVPDFRLRLPLDPNNAVGGGLGFILV
jgi:hypothetical protein